MNVFAPLLLLTQAFGTAPDFPRLADPEPVQEERPGVFPWFGVEAVGLWTRFDDDLRIRDAWGSGVDAVATLDFGTRTMVAFRVGYFGWDTRTDDDVRGNDRVRIRQYRFGASGHFALRFLELSIGANVGAFRFRREKDNDTAMYVEFQGRLGVRPHPQFFAGVTGIQTFSITDFNRSGHHFIVDYSIGPVVELRF
jgi:hypothetical protein